MLVTKQLFRTKRGQSGYKAANIAGESLTTHKEIKRRRPQIISYAKLALTRSVISREAAAIFHHPTVDLTRSLATYARYQSSEEDNRRGGSFYFAVRPQQLAEGGLGKMM